MKIERLHIGHFGRFSDYTLDFKNGFSILYGDNEDGKSTILECLRMLFYGSSGRGSDPARNPRVRYLPWDGTKMSAAVEFEEKGRRYRLERRFGKTNAGDRVTLKDALTGESLPCTGEPGEEFFGMGISAFEKSLFIGQLGGFSGSGDKEDEMNRRLANLVSTGDETASYTQVAQRLLKAQNSLSTARKVGSLDKQEQKLEALREELQAARNLEEQEASLKSQRKEREERQRELSEKEQTAERLLKIQEELKKLEAGKRELQQACQLEELEKEEDALEKVLSGSGDKRVDSVLLQEADTLFKDLGIQRVLYNDAAERLHKKEEEQKNFLEEQSAEKSIFPTKEEMEEFFRLKKQLAENEESREKGQKLLRLQKQMKQVKDAREALEKSRSKAERCLPEIRKQEEECTRLREEKEKAEAALSEAELAHRQLLWKREQEESLRREAEEEAQKERKIGRRKKLLFLAVGGVLLLLGIFLGATVHPAGYAFCAVGAAAAALGAFSAKATSASQEKVSPSSVQEEEGLLRLEEIKGRLSRLLPVLEESEKQLEALREEERLAREESKRDEGVFAYCETFLKNSLSSFTPEEIRAATESFERGEIALRAEGEISENAAEERMADILSAFGCKSVEELEDLCRSRQECLHKQELLEQERSRASEEVEKKKRDVLRLASELRTCLSPFSEKELHTGEELSILLKRLREAWEKAQQLAQKKKGILQALERAPGSSEVLRKELQQREAALRRQNGGELPQSLSLEEAKKLEAALRQIRKERGELQLQEGAQGQQAADLWRGRRSVSQLERMIAEEELSAGEKRERLEALRAASDAMEQAFRELQSGYGPLLNKASAEIFSRLTGGKYTGMLVDKSFGLSVMEKGESTSHEWKYLSSGTVDQAYFALRLAISRLITGEEEAPPLFLDDVFAQYDETRTQRGLKFLSEYAEERGNQILLFTCHRHLAVMAEKEGASVCCIQERKEA